MGGKSSKAAGDIDLGKTILPSNASEYEAALAGDLVQAADLSEDPDLKRLMRSGGYGSGKRNLKPIMREIRNMRKDLPVGEAPIFVRFDKKRPYMMKVAIVGAPGTPYSSGFFVFAVVCPVSYPAMPPKVEICTTGGGSYRFNPNLYSNGKVCLSLLGTWSGTAACEKWSSKSTLLQVFMSIQGLIMTSTPWYNEPGRGAPSCQQDANGTRQRNDINGGLVHIQRGTLQWAVAEQLKKPDPVFADVIRKHFELREEHITTVAAAWLKDSEKHKDTALPQLKAVVEHLPAAFRQFHTGEAAPVLSLLPAALSQVPGAGAGAHVPEEDDTGDEEEEEEEDGEGELPYNPKACLFQYDMNRVMMQKKKQAGQVQEPPTPEEGPKPPCAGAGSPPDAPPTPLLELDVVVEEEPVADVDSGPRRRRRSSTDIPDLLILDERAIKPEVEAIVCVCVNLEGGPREDAQL